MTRMPYPGCYPTARPRRNRVDDATRRMVAETKVTVDDLIWPIFLKDEDGPAEPVPSMPDVYRYSISQAVSVAHEAAQMGLPAVVLFPCTPDGLKTDDGRESFNPDNLTCRAIRAIKASDPGLAVMTDIALDPYTTHGHDGVIRNGKIANDQSVEVLVRQALAQADAGADILAPSDMMDGRIGAIRHALEQADHDDVRIMAYAAKYASAFYGPFRDAVGSGGALKGDKKTYQMDPANAEEALRETALDITEGADMVMVKPGLPYLDIIQRVKQAFGVPTAVYHVSGEYSMLRAAAERGWMDYERGLMEVLLSFKRAGADMILTYGAPHAAALLSRHR